MTRFLSPADCSQSVRLRALPDDQRSLLLPVLLRDKGTAVRFLFQDLCRLYRLLAENLLRIDQLFPPAVDSFITAVRLHDLGFDGIRQLYLQDTDRFLPDVGIQQGEEDLHPAVQVPGHPVGAGAVDLRHAAVLKVIDPAVFQEIADDRADTDIVTDAGNAGLQAADPADDQADADTRRAGGVEGCDNIRIAERVHFGYSKLIT